MAVLVDKSLDFSKYIRENSVPQLWQTTPRITTNVSISAAGGQQSYVDIPLGWFNLSKSVLEYDRTMVTYLGTATGYSNMFLDSLADIQDIELITQRGTQIEFIQNVNVYTNMINKYNVRYEDFASADWIQPVTGVTSTKGGSSAWGTPFHPNNALISGNQAQRPTNGGNGGLTGGPCYMNYVEPQYVLNKGKSATSGGMLHTVRMCLGDLYHTFFNSDKMVYYSEPLVFRIVWGSNARIGYAAAGITGGRILPSTSTITISNINLYVAHEQNPDVMSALESRVKSEGISFYYESPYMQKTNLSGANQTFTFRLDQGTAHTLRKVYIAPYHNTEQGPTAYSHANMYITASTMTKVDYYYTTLNSMRLQQFNVLCYNNQDYTANKGLINGSAVGAVDVYRYNWVHCDSWVPHHQHWFDDNVAREGYDLDGKRDVIWTFVSYCAAAQTLNHYAYAILTRMIAINAAGVAVV